MLGERTRILNQADKLEKKGPKTKWNFIRMRTSCYTSSGLINSSYLEGEQPIKWHFYGEAGESQAEIGL